MVNRRTKLRNITSNEITRENGRQNDRQTFRNYKLRKRLRAELSSHVRLKPIWKRINHIALNTTDNR